MKLARTWFRFLLLATSVAGTSGCDDSRPQQETVAQPATKLTAPGNELLEEIRQDEFEPLEKIRPYQAEQSVQELGPLGASSGVSIVTVITPSGPKQVPGGETVPDVFGHPIQLNDLHAIILGKGVPKGVNPKALFGEPLLYAALTLVGGAADPSSVPVVATLLTSPNKKTRGWARETLGAMGENGAALRAPIAEAVSNVLRPRNQDVGQMPEWLIAACRQPLVLYQDASGKVHVGGETYDTDAARQVITEHIGKTKDDYVILDRSPQTPRDLWLALEGLVKELGLEPLGWESVALAESVWSALETEPSPSEQDRTGDSEPPSPDARVVALYEAGKVGEARYALVSIAGVSYEGVTRRTASISLLRRTVGLEEALRHAHVVRLVRRCLAWEQKMKTGVLSRAIGADRSAIVSVAAQVRETMQKVLDLVEWLKAERPSAITPLMRERVESARRELALLVAEEVTALREFGRFEQAKELEDRYGSAKDIAQDNGRRSRDSAEKERIDRLAKKWYGGKTTIEEVRIWKGLRITAAPYNIPGNAEMRWLLLLADNKIGVYNGIVVPMAMNSSRNKWILMPDEARERLLAISRPTGESGVSEDQKLNPLAIPYLLQTESEKSEIWTKGEYTYAPVQEVREYVLKLVPDNENPHWIPQTASVYVDQDGVVIHHKITDVLTVSS